MSSAHKASRKLQATDSGSLSALEQAMQDLDPVETQDSTPTLTPAELKAVRKLLKAGK